jgi:hypothetical protein
MKMNVNATTSKNSVIGLIAVVARGDDGGFLGA